MVYFQIDGCTDAYFAHSNDRIVDYPYLRFMAKVLGGVAVGIRNEFLE